MFYVFMLCIEIVLTMFAALPIVPRHQSSEANARVSSGNVLEGDGGDDSLLLCLNVVTKKEC